MTKLLYSDRKCKDRFFCWLDWMEKKRWTKEEWLISPTWTCVRPLTWSHIISLFLNWRHGCEGWTIWWIMNWLDDYIWITVSRPWLPSTIFRAVSECRGVPQIVKQLENSFCEERSRDLGLFSLEKRSEEISLQLFCTLRL